MHSKPHLRLFSIGVIVLAASSLYGQESTTTTATQTATSQTAMTVPDTVPTTAVETVIAPDENTIPDGFIGVVFGSVENVKIRLKGVDPWIDAVPRLALSAETEVLTAQGKTKLRLLGKGQLRVPPMTHIKLRMMNENTVAVLIQRGTVWNQVSGNPDVGYVVQTPDLAAGVRGGLFKVEVSDSGGSRLAVFEGLVRAQSSRQPGQVYDVRPYRAVTIDRQGNAPGGITSASAEEMKEWTEWDEWAMEVHQEIGSRFAFGGDTISNLAKLQAMDAKRADALADEAAANIAWNREGDHVNAIRDAFLQFYKDTGHQPSEEEGYSVLVQNTGGWATWKGPYLKDADAQIPPTDRWGTPIRYQTIQTPGGKTVYAVLSAGPNKVFSQGKTDDILAYVLYRTVQR